MPDISRIALASRRTVAALALLALAGCGSSGPTPSASGIELTPPTEGALSAAGPTASPPAPSIQVVSSPTTGAYGLALDPSLLAVLPGALGDLPMTESPDVESPLLQDQNLAKHADRAAGAVVGDLGGSDWATASVVELRPEDRTDAFTAQWRSDYDTAACADAGGLAGQETVQLGGRPVDHDTCQGGVDLYLVDLRDRGLLVSITSVGTLQLGQQLAAGLQP